jgi:hypothetical protein
LSKYFLVPQICGVRLKWINKKGFFPFYHNPPFTPTTTSTPFLVNRTIYVKYFIFTNAFDDFSTLALALYL